MSIYGSRSWPSFGRDLVLHLVEEEIGLYTGDDPYNWSTNNRPFKTLLENDLFLAAEVLRRFGGKSELLPTFCKTPIEAKFFSENRPGFVIGEVLPLPSMRKIVPYTSFRLESDNDILLSFQENDNLLSHIITSRGMHYEGFSLPYHKLDLWPIFDPVCFFELDNKPIKQLLANDIAIAKAIGIA
jgi:hypothetical protein